MGFKGITVNTAASADAHIFAEDDAAIYQAIFGGDGVMNIGNKFSATVLSNNKVRVYDGVLCVGGHIGRMQYADYADMTIENGVSGKKRNDIIYAKFVTSGDIDSYVLDVRKGTEGSAAADPAMTQGNLYQGATLREYPLWRVKIEGLSIVKVEQMFSVIPTIPELRTEMRSGLSEVNSILGTMQTNIYKNNEYKDKTISQILALMPANATWYIPYITQCADSAAIQGLGFSQYSTIRLIKSDDWSETVVVTGINGFPVGIWHGNKNTTDIPGSLYVYNPSNFSVNYANASGKINLGDYNKVTLRSYKGTPSSGANKDGGVFLQSDFTNNYVIVGIDGLGEIGVNRAANDSGGWNIHNYLRGFFTGNGNTSHVYGGAKAHLWTDNEGGNLRLTSPKGSMYAEFDCYNNDGLRIYTVGDGSKGIFIGTDGNLTVLNGYILFGNGGGKLAGDGNLYMKVGNYNDWLSNILNSKAAANHSHSYLPLSGGTLTGNIGMANGKVVQWASGAVINGNSQSILFGGSGDSNYQAQLSVAEGAWSLHPTGNEKLRLGSASYKWREIYSNTGAIQTSDRNQKDNIYDLADNDKILQFFLLLQPVSFTFRDGTSGRTHIGFIAQDVEAAMEQVGMTDLDFAGFCKDQKHIVERKTREVKRTDPETGESYTAKEEYLEEIPVEGEYIYSLRYEEFIAINTMMIQQLYADVAILKKDVQMLKNNVD